MAASCQCPSSRSSVVYPYRGCARAHRRTTEGGCVPENGIIQVSGASLALPDGSPVVLRGVGLGGWMNMENFITGYPGTESQQRKALRAALGEEGYRRFFDRFLDDFFTDADAQFLAGLGLNCVRIPLSYKHFEDDDRPGQLKEEGFRRLDQAVDACARAGILSILDLHALPGYQNQHWHSDNPTHWAHFWTHRDFQDSVVHLWEALAEHYRDNPWVGGYQPINTGTPLGRPPTPRSTSMRTPSARRSARSTGGWSRRSAPSTRSTCSSSTATGTPPSSTSSATHCPTPSTPRTTTRCPASSTAARTPARAGGSTSTGPWSSR